jgi:Fur family ferric uptake transcriptional regulator
MQPGDLAGFVADLRQHGLRVTPQRRAIWQVFAEPGCAHLTADEVFGHARAYLPEVSRATVYNTLGEFVRVGLLRVVEGFGPALYDPNLDPTHQHFRCQRCGQLYDVHVAGAPVLELVEPGFAISRVQITVEGRCPECRS